MSDHNSGTLTDLPKILNGELSRTTEMFLVEWVDFVFQAKLGSQANQTVKLRRSSCHLLVVMAVHSRTTFHICTLYKKHGTTMFLKN